MLSEELIVNIEKATQTLLPPLLCDFGVAGATDTEHKVPPSRGPELILQTNKPVYNIGKFEGGSEHLFVFGMFSTTAHQGCLRHCLFVML